MTEMTNPVPKTIIDCLELITRAIVILNENVDLMLHPLSCSHGRCVVAVNDNPPSMKKALILSHTLTQALNDKMPDMGGTAPLTVLTAFAVAIEGVNQTLQISNSMRKEGMTQEEIDEQLSKEATRLGVLRKHKTPDQMYR